MVCPSARLILRCTLALSTVLCSVQSNVAHADTDFIFADGFDVNLAAAFFVSPQGVDTNPGSMALPFQTITKGITAAAVDPLKRTVVVAAGTYGESISLADGVSLFGQYQSGGWARDPTTYSIVNGVSSVGNHDSTVIATNITSQTTMDGFVIYGAVNNKVGGNSYAIYVSGSNANLKISNNIIFGGHGGPGADGPLAPDGLAGAPGSGRNPNLSVADTAYDAKDAIGAGECNASNNRQYPNGGARMCGGTSIAGGAGGGNRCPVMSFCDSGDANFGCMQNTSNFHWMKFTALDGTAGAPGGVNGGTAGAGATAGDDMIQIYAPFYGGYVCYIPPDPTLGANGSAGGGGGHGAGVAGCSAASGFVFAGHWIGGSAPAGNVGGNGGGGGGGGAGGGGKCESTTGHTTCADGGGRDTLGGHAGGGGSGGCGGSGGSGGGSGGGAFDIFIVGSGAGPVVTSNTLFGGTGGGGGSGGNAGAGGSGGPGALGGTNGVPVIFCTDTAGHGGIGGDGGDGAGGGGGCGGASFGIYTSGIGSPNYCQPVANNTIGAGSAGTGGAGGLSLVNSGASGQPGVLANCSFN